MLINVYVHRVKDIGDQDYELGHFMLKYHVLLLECSIALAGVFDKLNSDLLIILSLNLHFTRRNYSILCELKSNT